DRTTLLGRKLELEHRSSRRELERLGPKVNLGRSRNSVERSVREPRTIRRDHGPAYFAAPVAGEAAHFEHIDEVGIEIQGEPDRARLLVEVPHGEHLVTSGVPQELHPRDMDRVP